MRRALPLAVLFAAPSVADHCVGLHPRGEPHQPPHDSACRRKHPHDAVANATAPAELLSLLPTFEAQRNRLGLNVTASKCTLTSARAECSYQTATVGGRPVYYQVPDGTPPSGGWPVMLYFHAWYGGGASDWAANYPTRPNWDGGVYWEVATKKALLDMGVAWLSPDGTSNGGNACPSDRDCWWETNMGPYKTTDLSAWQRSNDHSFLLQLFSAMDGGTFGSTLNQAKMHTGGYSAGGFMASRMPFNYPEKGWKSMFNLAASLFYCCGCGLGSCPESWLDNANIASLLRSAHPPTLFLHGAADTCVTPQESAMYNRRLESAGVTTKYVSPSGEQHHWFAGSAEEVSAWVQRHG